MQPPAFQTGKVVRRLTKCMKEQLLVMLGRLKSLDYVNINEVQM